MALAQFGTFLALLAPVTVSLALKVQTLVPQEQQAAALGTVLSVAAIVALAGSVPVVLAGWMLGQLGGNMILAPLLTTIADQVPENQRATVSANVGVMQNLGILAAAYVASWFVQDMLLLFLVPAVFAFITVALYCAVLPDRQVRVHPQPPQAWRAMLSTFWVNPRKHPDYGWAWASRFRIILASFLFITFRVFFLQDRVSLTTEEAVQAITLGVLLYTIALVITAKLGGWLSDRFRRRKVFVFAAAALFALGTYLLVHVTSVGAFYGVEILMGAGYGMYYAVDMALVVDVLPNPDDSAKDLGVMNIANALPQSLAGAIGAFLLGLGASAAPNYTLLYATAAIIGLAGAAAILPIKKVR